MTRRVPIAPVNTPSPRAETLRIRQDKDHPAPGCQCVARTTNRDRWIREMLKNVIHQNHAEGSNGKRCGFYRAHSNRAAARHGRSVGSGSIHLESLRRPAGKPQRPKMEAIPWSDFKCSSGREETLARQVPEEPLHESPRQLSQGRPPAPAYERDSNPSDACLDATGRQSRDRPMRVIRFGITGRDIVLDDAGRLHDASAVRAGDIPEGAADRTGSIGRMEALEKSRPQTEGAMHETCCPNSAHSR
jgi:hypothetical protein